MSVDFTLQKENIAQEEIVEVCKTNKTQKQKINWDEYFFGIMHAVAARATCDRGRSGCIIAKDNQLLVSGYVGALPKFLECDEVGHELEVRFRIGNDIILHFESDVDFAKKLFSSVVEGKNYSVHCIRTIHAEQNAIYQAARQGISLEGATLYCTMTPCRICAAAIIRVGIVRVVCEKKYHQGKITEEMFEKAGVKISFKNDEIMKY